MSASRDPDRARELAAELAEEIDLGNEERVEELARELHRVDPNAGPGSAP